jgi:uncharacterized protein
MTNISIKHTSFIIAASLMALALPAATSFADVDLGVKKYQAGDFKGAISEWTPLATKGDANAAFNLGQAYRLGRGVKQDMSKAVLFYEQAAKNGHVAAQGNLGTLLYFSAAPVQSRKKAVEWWHTAAQNGDNRAQYMLGVLYFNGDDVEKDWSRAYAYASMAKDAGLKEAETSFAEMVRHMPEADVQKGNVQKAKLIATRSTNSNTAPPALADNGKSKPLVAWNTATNALPQATLPATEAQIKAAAMQAETTPIQQAAPSNLPTVFAGVVPAQAAPASVSPASASAPIVTTLTAVAPAVVSTSSATPAAPLSGWRVQLGAFGTQSAAESAWTMLQRKASNTLASSAPSFETAGSATRLLVSGFDKRTDANGLCAKLKSQGVVCFVKAN